MVINMYRKYINDLLNWYKDSRRKPLMLWGARQVGKTYLMKNLFAEKYFKGNYIYIDCDNNAMAKDLFASDYNIDRILLPLEPLPVLI